MSRLLRGCLAAGLWWTVSCSAGGAGPELGVPPDGALMMSGDLGSSGLDMQPPSGDLSTPDPAGCAVGAADGCCPLLRHGGSDPDCPKLACARFDRSPPILLDDVVLGAGSGGAGEVGMAWTGRELALAWAYVNLEAREQKLIFERRRSDGTLSYGPVSNAFLNGFIPANPAAASLSYEPAQRSYLFADVRASYRADGLDGAGVPQWEYHLATMYCKMPFVDAMSSGSRWYIGQNYSTCTGESSPRIESIDFDGTNRTAYFPGDGFSPKSTDWGAFAFDPTAKRLFTIYSRRGEGDLGGRFLNVAANTLEPGFVLRPGPVGYNFENLGMAFDGQRFGIVFEEEPSLDRYRHTFQLYDPRTGWVGSPVVLGDSRDMVQPRVLWTGEGFVIAMTLENTSPKDTYTAQVYSLAPDGTVRESFIADSNSALFPNLMWAGGRIALTWSRMTGRSPTAHYLQYLSCPP